MSNIAAIVSMDKNSIAGGAPIFIVETQEEMQQIAFKLEKIMDTAAHDLENGTIILVKHD
jgi:hypothetical protein